MQETNIQCSSNKNARTIYDFPQNRDFHLYNTILHILSSLTYYLISDQWSNMLFPTNEVFIRRKNYRRLRSTTNITYQRRKTSQLERTKSATTICLDVHFSLEKCLLKCKARMYSQPTLKLRPMVSEKSALQNAVEIFRTRFWNILAHHHQRN